MYHAFNPTEMEILAGYIWGYQHILVPVRGKNELDKIVILRYELVPMPPVIKEFDVERPYTISERFLEAVKVFATVKNVRFENCIYHANNNTVEAKAKMDERRERASKQIHDAIKNWDTSVLTKMAEKHKATLEGTKLNFKPVPAQPLEVIHTISDLEELAHEKHPADLDTATALTFEEPVLSTNTSLTEEVAQPEKGRRGMPKGGWPKKDK